MNRTIPFICLFYVLQILYRGLNCEDFHLDLKHDCAEAKTEDFVYSRKSRSVIIEKDSTVRYHVVFYGRKEYRLGLCTTRKFYPLHFRLLDESDKNRVLYDNKNDDYNKTISFAMVDTKSLIIEVTPLGEKVREDVHDIDSQRSCLGIAIYYRSAPKIGF